MPLPAVSLRWFCVAVVALCAACAAGGQSAFNAVPNGGGAPSGVLGPKRRLHVLRIERRHVFPSRHHKRKATRNAAQTPVELAYHGGAVETAPVAYLIFWGFDGPTDGAHDPYGLASYLAAFMQSIPGSSWLATVTQYYQTVGGPTAYIPDGASLYGGATYDPVPPPHTTYTDAQAADEAVKIAQTVGYNPGANYIVVTPHTYTIDGFGSTFCGYHSSVTTDSGPLSYTVLPYMPDADVSCGEGSVDVPGTLDGATIVGGHEEAETETDPIVGTGWDDPNGNEVADKCAWTDLQNTSFSHGRSYPTQPLWSDASSSCVQSYVAATPSPQPVGTPTPTPSPQPVGTPTPSPSPRPIATPTPIPANTVRNAGFELGRLRPWHTCRSSGAMGDARISSVEPYSGTYDAYAGTRLDHKDVDGETSVCQLVSIPANGRLTVWTRGVSDDFRPGVYQFARLYDSSGTVAKTLFKMDRNEKKWRRWTFALTPYSNGRYSIAFGIEGKARADDRYIGLYVDDVSVR